MNIKNLDNIEDKLKDSIDWVRANLNPHQKLEITLDGIRIVSDDLYVPLVNKKDNEKVEINIDGEKLSRIWVRGKVEEINYGQV